MNKEVESIMLVCAIVEKESQSSNENSSVLWGEKEHCICQVSLSFSFEGSCSVGD